MQNKPNNYLADYAQKNELQASSPPPWPSHRSAHSGSPPTLRLINSHTTKHTKGDKSLKRERRRRCYTQRGIPVKRGTRPFAKFLLAFLVYAVFVGCQNQLANDSLLGDTSISINDSKSITSMNIPYASDDILEGFTKSDTKHADWRLIRQLTLIEFEDYIKSQHSWEGCVLSAKPVVVYDNESLPQYYEFIVIDASGRPVGTITAFAKKQYFEVVSHVLPFIRNYDQATSKSPGHREFDVGAYPNTAIGLLGKSGESPSALADSATGEPADFYVPDNELEEYAMMDDETLLRVTGMTRDYLDDMLRELEETETEIEEATREYWESVEHYQKEFMSLTEDEIREAYADTTKRSYWGPVYQHTIPDYASTEAQQTIWMGWCVPSAIAYVYRNSISKYYDGTFLPGRDHPSFVDGGVRRTFANNPPLGAYVYGSSVNDSWIKSRSNISDGGLYYKLMTTRYEKWRFLFFYETTTALSSGGGVYTTGFDDLMRAASDGRYTMSPTSFSSMASRMESGYPGFISIPRHMVVGIGYMKRTYYGTRRYRFLFWTWKRDYQRTSYWFKITDNGYITASRGGKNYTPFWESLGAIQTKRVYSLRKR